MAAIEGGHAIYILISMISSHDVQFSALFRVRAVVVSQYLLELTVRFYYLEHTKPCFLTSWVDDEENDMACHITVI